MRLAPSFVRHLFVICSSFVRHLFVHCSSFVRSLFVHCSFIVRSLFVHCSFIVRSLFVHCSLFHYLLLWLAPSFVFLRLDSVSLYLQISLVFQTDSLYQFLFKACPPSGVRGLFTRLFSICPCTLHRFLYELSPSFKLWQS